MNIDTFFHKNNDVFDSIVSHVYEFVKDSNILCNFLNKTKNVYIIDTNKKEIVYNNQIDQDEYPIMFCLGGSAYNSYGKILNQQINVLTHDYDISFSLTTDHDENLITEEIIKLFDEISESKYIDEIITNKKKINNEKGFTIIKDYNLFMIEKDDDKGHKNKKLLYRFCINYNNKTEHLIELSFWKNNKVSDDFYYFDFDRTEIFMVIDDKDNFHFLLSPNILTRTTYGALKDKIDNNNLDLEKCTKHVERIKFMRDTINKNTDNLLVKQLKENQLKDIEDKYHKAYNYPFILYNRKFGDQITIKKILSKFREMLIKKCEDASFPNEFLINM